MLNRLYIHIPFCQHKCPYCAFVSRAGHEQHIGNYVEMLITEMQLASSSCKPARPLDSAYFGGGTPSLLTPAQAESILDSANTIWGLSPQAEITLETNPGTVTFDKLAGFHHCGINRLSIGVQSFDDLMLSKLGRIHSAQQAHNAFAAARKAGFDNIGIDLIHTLPGQTMAMWQSDLQQALRLNPEHISVYGLTIEDGTPFAEQYEDESALPDDDASADMFETADAVLTAAGYTHYEIANYARPGFHAGHNSGYWQREGYLGLGAGAHSLLLDTPYGTRFSNTTDIDAYCAAISSGKLPRQDLHQLSRQDAISEHIFLGLRMADGISFRRFEELFCVGLDEVYSKEIEKLTAQGLLVQSCGNLRLSLRGMLLSNQVFSAFI